MVSVFFLFLILFLFLLFILIFLLFFLFLFFLILVLILAVQRTILAGLAFFLKLVTAFFLSHNSPHHAMHDCVLAVEIDAH